MRKAVVGVLYSRRLIVFFPVSSPYSFMSLVLSPFPLSSAHCHSLKKGLVVVTSEHGSPAEEPTQNKSGGIVLDGFNKTDKQWMGVDGWNEGYPTFVTSGSFALARNHNFLDFWLLVHIGFDIICHVVVCTYDGIQDTKGIFQTATHSPYLPRHACSRRHQAGSRGIQGQISPLLPSCNWASPKMPTHRCGHAPKSCIYASFNILQ